MTDPVPETAVSGLDALTRHLADRASAVSQLQRRMSRLLAAQLSLSEDLDLASVLTRIVEAAVELVDARYGAIGVLAPDGSLEQFLHVGAEPDTAAKIGHSPRGLGLLGALVHTPEPLRLARLGDDPRSVGFPEHHPPMSRFLGVPIRLRDEVFGNLYLCDRRDDEPFSADDEEFAKALATSAGVAIENARLYEAARHRQRWAEGSAQVVGELTDPGADSLQVIADRVRELADADLVTVLLPVDGALVARRTSGDEAERLLEHKVLTEDSLPNEAIRSGRPQLIDDVADPPLTVDPSGKAYGAEMAVPMLASNGPHGVLLVSRYRGRPRFTETDIDVAASFAAHATMALELARAHRDREQMLLLQDRERIARDLHDHVVQRLFATGLTLQALASAGGGEEVAAGLAAQIDEIDQIGRQVRNTIFELQPPGTPTNLRTDVLRAVRAAAKLFVAPPQVRFSGPLDTLVPVALHEDILAVVREGLSNTARHANADRVEVLIHARAEAVRIEVRDDGVGIEATGVLVRSGLQNLQARAAQIGGTMDVVRGEPAGTVLSWTVPLERARS